MQTSGRVPDVSEGAAQEHGEPGDGAERVGGRGGGLPARAGGLQRAQVRARARLHDPADHGLQLPADELAASYCQGNSLTDSMT